jgi:multidrug efflux pump subunit AcrA (membrane-fusion protein)
MPLRTADGDVMGACILLGGHELIAPGVRQFLAAAAQPIAACLKTLQSAKQPAWRQFLPERLQRALATRRKRIAAAAAVAVLTLLLPLPYKVSCQCELQPTTRRFVGAPYEGIFDKSFARPGDLVKRDQVLGRMDGRVVRWELAGLAADEQRAGKSRDVNMAGGKIAASQIDRFEMERISLKRQLLRNRAEQLEIKSPLDGIVLSGDLQRSEGVAVTIGQPLYEVAPLDRMLAEVAISDGEISHIQPGQTVTIHLDAYPGQTWTGDLDKVHPRSEVRENENVFIGEVLLENGGAALRPGMKGWVKITTTRHTLAWIMFHKPCDAVLAWLGY